MIKIQRNSKKIVQQYDYYPLFELRVEPLSSPLLLEDREIITAMRYNFDIKNSLFDYRNSLPYSYAKYTSQLFTAAAATAFKRLYTPSDKENLIWNKSRNTFFIADNSNALLILKQWMYLKLPWKKQRTSLDVVLKHDDDKDIFLFLSLTPHHLVTSFSPPFLFFFAVILFNLRSMIWILEYISVNASCDLIVNAKQTFVRVYRS